MNITLTNNWVEFALENHEDNEVLRRIGKSTKYSQILSDLITRYPQIFENEDWKDPKFVSKVGRMVRSEKYQNHLAYTFNSLSGNDSLYFNPWHKEWDAENGQYKIGKNFLPVEMWDGTRSYLPVRSNSRRLKCWNGWFRRIYKFIVKNYPDMELKMYDKRVNKIGFIKDYVNVAGKFTLRDYQTNVVKRVITSLSDSNNLGHYFHTVCLDLATNTGKTPIIGGLIANMHPDTKILIPLTRQELFLKTLCDVVEDMGHTEGVGVIVSTAMASTVKKHLKAKGIDDNLNYNTFSRITLVMVPTFISRIKSGKYDGEVIKKYEVCIYDECHLATSETFRNFTKYGEFGLRIGLSGTPFDSKDKKKNFDVMSLFGEVRFTINNSDNISRGVSLQPDVTMYNYSTHVSPVYVGRFTSPETVKDKYIYYNSSRFKTLKNILIDSPKLPTVIYFGNASLDSGKAIREFINYELPDLKVAYTDGEDKDTWKKVDAFLSGEIQILIVNRIFQLGINIPNIEHFINWEATDNKVAIKQAVLGRSIRSNGEEVSVKISDFMDNKGVYKTFSNSRMDIYKDEANSCKFKVSSIYE